MTEVLNRDLPSERSTTSGLELTILMPCLNEVETISGCIAKAKSFLERASIVGEVLIADNGSSDGSVALAQRGGATVITVAERGYGAALRAGIAAARGRFVIMGDADDSYDFSNLDPFIAKLRAGCDLVMGNRFTGGIAPGAMPFLHRYLGNPLLSFIGRMFFRAKIGDFHCGLRGFRRDAILALDLRSSGMELASEMVVRAAVGNLNMGLLFVSYQASIEAFAKDPRIPPEVFKDLAEQLVGLKMIDAIAAQKTTLTAYYDNRYVDELEKAGFFKRLWQ